MKKLILSLAILGSAAAASAQCNELFISEYVEGSGNNKAIEIYNPTNSPVDLSNYSIVRFSNGATSPDPVKHFMQLNGTVAAKDVYVAGLDKQDTTGQKFEAPLWNGYVELDGNNNAVFTGTVGDSPYKYSTTYRDTFDLMNKVDGFYSPVYNDNNTFYWNGNDAVALISGTSINPTGSNIIDVVGVIGEDPANGQWETSSGRWITKNTTLVRNKSVKAGSGAVLESQGDTIAYSDWTFFNNNVFINLGSHDCDCNTASSTSEAEATTAFEVFPNPAHKGLITLRGAQRVERVEVFNLLGQSVQTVQYNSTRKQVNFLLNVEAGAYVVMTTFEDGRKASQKLMVR